MSVTDARTNHFQEFICYLMYNEFSALALIVKCETYQYPNI
jgi:hypothetical protein